MFIQIHGTTKGFEVMRSDSLMSEPPENPFRFAKHHFLGCKLLLKLGCPTHRPHKSPEGLTFEPLGSHPSPGAASLTVPDITAGVSGLPPPFSGSHCLSLPLGGGAKGACIWVVQDDPWTLHDAGQGCGTI